MLSQQNKLWQLKTLTAPSVYPVHRMDYIHYFTVQAKCRACPQIIWLFSKN